MKIQMGGLSLKAYAKRVHEQSESARWVGNVHLRSGSQRASNVDVVVLSRKEMSPEDSARKLQEFREVQEDAFLSDQSKQDQDLELGFSKVKKADNDSFRFASIRVKPDDPQRTYKLQTADIDRYGEVSRSVAMRSVQGGLEAVEVSGSLVKEYVFAKGKETAFETAFLIGPSYDKMTLGDKARNWWNELVD